MAEPFDMQTDLGRRLDWRLLQDSSLILYWRATILEEDVAELVRLGYQAVRLRAQDWLTEGDMHEAFAEAFGFPDYYGHNFDALNDCLGDVAAFRYGADVDFTGTVLVIERFDSFFGRAPAEGRALLDVLASRSRGALLIGHRILVLLQSDDPHLDLPPAGPQPVLWNPREWLTTSPS